MLARLKLQVATNGAALAGICVIVGLLALAGAGYVYATPGVEEQPPQEVDSFEIEVELDDSTVITEDNALYEEGHELRSSPVYFLNFTPDITLEATVDGPADRELNVTHELLLLEQANRDGNEFWSRETTLAESQSLVTDGTKQTNASLNIQELAVRQDEIGQVIDSVSSPTAQLRLVTTYETEPVAGESYEGTLVVSGDISFVGNAVWIDGDRTASDSEERLAEQEPIELSPNVFLIVVLAVSGVGLLGLSGIVLRRSQTYDPEELRIEVYTDEYSEWISAGEFVVDPDRQYVYVNSLKDLVNIGIDADKRVIHDTDLDAYIVADSDLIYYYAREPTNIELWANVGSGGNQS